MASLHGRRWLIVTRGSQCPCLTVQTKRGWHSFLGPISVPWRPLPTWLPVNQTLHPSEGGGGAESQSSLPLKVPRARASTRLNLRKLEETCPRQKAGQTPGRGAAGSSLGGVPQPQSWNGKEDQDPLQPWARASAPPGRSLELRPGGSVPGKGWRPGAR